MKNEYFGPSYQKSSPWYDFILTAHAFIPNADFNMISLNQLPMYSYQFSDWHFIPLRLDTLSLEGTSPKCPYPAHHSLH
jgi:hypothetical protein